MMLARKKKQGKKPARLLNDYVPLSLVPSGPPQNINCQSRSPNSLLLEWSKPAREERNGIIRGYWLQYYPRTLWYGKSSHHYLILSQLAALFLYVTAGRRRCSFSSRNDRSSVKLGLPPSFPPLTDCICSYPMMNFTLAIWQLPFPCFCRIQYYFEIASFPPCKARARARASKIGLLTMPFLGRAGRIRPTVADAGLRAFDEKVGLPKFAHSLLASFHTVASMYPTPFVFFRIVARHKTTPTRRRHSRRRRLC